MTALTIKTPRVFAPLLKPSRYKGAHGGRGSGKSHFFAELLIERHVISKTNSVCVREIQKSLNQSVKKLLENKIEELGVQKYFEVQESVIKCRNGGMIIFQGMQNHTADSIKSLEGYDIAWVEEAQSLSQRSLDLLRPTIRKEDSELWFSWNPDKDTDPIDKFLRSDMLPPDAVVIEVNYMDNPWFPSVLRAEMEYDKERDYEKYKHVWMGGYKSMSEALVFKHWKQEDFDTPDDVVCYQGADWGFSVDPSVLIRCWIDGRKLYIDYEAYQIGCEIDRLPNLFEQVPGSNRWVITADSARPETISYMQRNGYPKIQSAVKGPRSIEEGVEFLCSFDIIVHPRCKHTIDELGSYSYKIDPLTGMVLPILSDKKNHVIDSLRYALENARKASLTATVFSQKALDKAIKECWRAKKTMKLSKGRLVDDAKGNLSVWTEPRKGARYVIGVKCGVNSPSSIDVLELPTGIQVAQWSGTIDHDLLAKEIDVLGKWYSNALVGILIDGAGYGLTCNIVLRDLGYNNIYTQRSINDRGSGDKEKKDLGWSCSKASVIYLIDQLHAELRDGTHGICCKDTITEMQAYVVGDDGSYGPQLNCSDSRVLSRAIAGEMLRSSPSYRKNKP